ncbi:MAG TPA: argininosuccinate lyase [Thermomicrobiales bacterium]|nr:argininosuccinate lyase [Thermomicrobiales bacterium]
MAEHSGAAKAWGGRFAESPDARLEAFNASVGFDVRMIREDIRGSIAHVRMLGRQNIVPVDEADSIEGALWQVLGEVEAGKFLLTIADEDVHTGVERRLRELVGGIAGKLHTGRSRNDQVATDFRLWTKRMLVEIATGLVRFGEALLTVARENADVIMPGYTHLQRAQPILLAHHMHAYGEMALRDLDRVREAFRRTDVLPLGSAALAGATYPLDRESVAADLGFARISANSLDAVSDRDFALDALYACSLISLHVSRLSEELILWSSGEFRYIEIADRFSTGSSIMPQKKNADIAELGRGKTGRIFGDLLALLTTMKGLPLAYNKDMQEDKEGLIDAVDTILAVLDVFPPMLESLTVHGDCTARAAIEDFTLATDAADMLAKAGVPFREAHEIVGSLVGRCIAEGKTFADLTDEEWAAVHPVFANERPPLDGAGSVALRDVPGGTAPIRVAVAGKRLEGNIANHREWVVHQDQVLEALFAPPSS